MSVNMCLFQVVHQKQLRTDKVRKKSRRSEENPSEEPPKKKTKVEEE